MNIAQDLGTAAAVEMAGDDLVEFYFEQGWTDGLPVVPPTREKIDQVIAVLGGSPDFVECKVPPRWGALNH